MLKDDIDFIANILRKGTVTWEGRRAVLRRARKKVMVRKNKKTGKPIYKFFWQCAVCFEWFRDEKDLEVDHVIEIGGFAGCWNKFIAKMYARERTAQQALCIACHKRKTAVYSNARLRWRRKNDKSTRG